MGEGRGDGVVRGTERERERERERESSRIRMVSTPSKFLHSPCGAKLISSFLSLFHSLDLFFALSSFSSSLSLYVLPVNHNHYPLYSSRQSSLMVDKEKAASLFLLLFPQSLHSSASSPLLFSFAFPLCHFGFLQDPTPTVHCWYITVGESRGVSQSNIVSTTKRYPYCFQREEGDSKSSTTPFNQTGFP